MGSLIQMWNLFISNFSMINFLKKTFIWLIVLFAITIGIFILQYNTSLKTHIDNPSFKKTTNNNFLLADSHGFKINTDSIMINNISNKSESYIDMENVLLHLLKHRDVDTLILSYDEHLFNTYRDNLNNNYKSVYLKSSKIIFTLKNIFKFNKTYITLFQNQIIFKIRSLLNFIKNKNESSIKKSFESFTNEER